MVSSEGQVNFKQPAPTLRDKKQEILLTVFFHISVCFSQVASYIQAANDIYNKVDFGGIKLINFKVKSLRVRSFSTQTTTQVSQMSSELLHRYLIQQFVRLSFSRWWQRRIKTILCILCTSGLRNCWVCTPRTTGATSVCPICSLTETTAEC